MLPSSAMRKFGKPGPEFAELFGRRGFVFLTVGRVLYVGGNGMAPIAVSFMVLDISTSGSDLGLVLAARGLAVVSFLLLGGIVADRVPRRAVMVGSAAVAALTRALTAALAVSGGVTVRELALLQVPNGAAASFLFPATSGALPQTVPPHLLRQANAVSRTGVNAMTIGGAALAGLVVAGVGPGPALAANAGVYAVAALTFVRVLVPGAVRGGRPANSMLGDLVEGWQEFRGLRWLWTTVVQFSLVNAAVAVGVETLGPLVAKQDLGGARSWGVIVAAQGVGLVAGALIASWWKPERPLRTGWLAVFAVVPVFVALALPAPTAVVAVAAVLAGLGVEVFGLNWDTLMQREIPADRLSRTYSYDALGSNASIPLGQTALAPGQALLGVQGVLWLLGGLVAAMALAGLRTGRMPAEAALAEAESVEPEPAEAESAEQPKPHPPDRHGRPGAGPAAAPGPVASEEAGGP